ncbi:MAG: glucosamine-6-phosphate deaminase [Geminicoccaceae bacterium]
MRLSIHDDKKMLGKFAAHEGADAIRAAIATKGSAAIVLATGVSQFEMLDVLVREEIDWSKVSAFHLDEYIGMGNDHPASFRRYLEERFIRRVSGLGEFVAIDGTAADPNAELIRLNRRIASETVDVCFAGIGENGHLAFNDPPADFDVDEPFILVELDDACRRQQLGEGWFETFDDVPSWAISMSIHQMMMSKKLILSVSDARKANAVLDAVEGPVTNIHPASITQNHDDCGLHLDSAAAGMLNADRLE